MMVHCHIALASFNCGASSDCGLSSRVEREFRVMDRSDSVSMVPPFLAYYGVLTGNRSAVAEAYNQIRLYRNYLRDSKAGGLWTHIVLGNGTDSGHWSTGEFYFLAVSFFLLELLVIGNGWAAAGMLRVLGTMKNSQYSSSFMDEQNNLMSWVLEIQDGMYSNIVITGSTSYTRSYLIVYPNN
jgi:rhamnogalacturonyl hydrolase YesR